VTACGSHFDLTVLESHFYDAFKQDLDMGVNQRKPVVSPCSLAKFEKSLACKKACLSFDGKPLVKAFFVEVEQGEEGVGKVTKVLVEAYKDK